MQPYFFPYVGYFQLINAVEVFVIYDNIEFSKKGWINRNRILVNAKDQTITLPLKKDSDYLNVVERRLADIWESEKNRMVNKISESYKRAPYFKDAFQVIERCILFNETNLFSFIYNSIREIIEYLEIATKIVVSSTLSIDHTLKAEKKVIAICKAIEANKYINPIGGLELYSKDDFIKEGIELSFLKSNQFSYKQFGNEFVPWLSIIDLMMFNSKTDLKKMLNSYSLI